MDIQKEKAINDPSFHPYKTQKAYLDLIGFDSLESSQLAFGLPGAVVLLYILRPFSA